MLGQSKKRFESNDGQNLSVILRRPQKVHTNLILNKQMVESFRMQENVLTCCEFKVDETGYYHVSSQITIKNVSAVQVLLDYFQMGICLKDMSNYLDNMKSMILNSNCHKEYVIADTLCAIVHLDKEETYNLWVNFGCENANNFEFQSNYSNLRIYKL